MSADVVLWGDKSQPGALQCGEQSEIQFSARDVQDMLCQARKMPDMPHGLVQ